MEEQLQKKNKSLEEAVELDMDLIYEVMARLPIETIFKCGAVCGSWRAVTKDQVFREQVSKLQSKKTHVLVQPSIGDNNRLKLISFHESKCKSLPLEPMLHELKIMSSCEGMLSMASATNLDPAVIYNPLTREKLFLPSCISHFKSSSIYQQVGVGYDYVIKKFKVLRAFSIQYDSKVIKKYEVLTLGEENTGFWRRLCSPKCIGRLEKYELSYCQGALYFISKPGYSLKVVQFDLKNETFCPVTFPHLNRNLKHTFSSLFDDDEGSVFLALGHRGVVRLLTLGIDDAVPRELAFLSQSWHYLPDTDPEWVHFNVLQKIERDVYLVNVGFSDTSVSSHAVKLFGEYYKLTSSELSLAPIELPNKPKAIAFKPSLVPLPTISSPPE